MSAFFEKHGLGAEFDKRLSAARDLLRRDDAETDDRGAPQGFGQRNAPHASNDYDGAGWIERLSREIGYERVERAFYLLIGGVILAGCVAIVMAGFRGSESARPVEGVTEVQLATPPAPQETAAATRENVAPQESQNLNVAATEAAPKAEERAAAAPEQPPAAPPPPVAMRDNQNAAPEAAPPTQQTTANPSANAEASAAEMPPASEAPRDSEMAMAAPDAAAEETPPPAAEPEAAPTASARDAGADDKASGAERAARCFLKVAGRVIAKGDCQVSRKGAAVTFLHSGQPVTVAPSRGREWSLTMGGRKLGAVYKVGGCWGSRKHTWICEKGA